MWFVIYLFGYKILDVRYNNDKPLKSYTEAETCDDAECGCNEEA